MQDVSLAGQILVVDDEPEIRAVVSDILSVIGHPVVAADGGSQALELVERCRPDLILLDIHMPDMDGRTFARALRARGSTIPLVIMTASPDAWIHAAELAAVGCLRKPFELTDLLAAVQTASARRTTGAAVPAPPSFSPALAAL